MKAADVLSCEEAAETRFKAADLVSAFLIIKSIIMNLEEFTHMLKTHDWTFEMSDDHRVWQKGRENYQRIISAIRLLISEGHEDEVRRIWSEVVPKNPMLDKARQFPSL